MCKKFKCDYRFVKGEDSGNFRYVMLVDSKVAKWNEYRKKIRDYREEIRINRLLKLKSSKEDMEKHEKLQIKRKKRMKKYRKKIYRKREKRTRNMMKDFHYKVAHYLCRNFENICIPHFNTH